MVGLINKEDIYNIADAIREKLQIEDTFKPSEMAELILSIPSSEDLIKYINVNITLAQTLNEITPDIRYTNVTIQ